MNWFDYIKKMYGTHPSYTSERIRVFVKVGRITEGQYKEITGKSYK